MQISDINRYLLSIYAAVPVHKKSDKQNYWPISMLPICGKKIFRGLIENDLSDSCIDQHLSLTYKIFKSFDDGFEVRSVFLDISKAFDKV